ncbi:MAG: pseudouridine synthase, partial [Verrucomicrobiota bacterium]
MALEILYHDAWLIVVDKPAGMLVHPGREPEPDDQIAMKVVRDQIGQRVSTIHRLDRPTSGILLMTVDSSIDSQMRQQFDSQLVKKRYTAVTIGELQEQWTNASPLQKSESEPFREAETAFVRQDIIQFPPHLFSLVHAYPASGRFHQIRKHLSMAGHPIVGDYLYGRPDLMDEIAEQIQQPRLMLHASQ